MSRNMGSYVPRALGTAYTPDAEGASEGDQGQPMFSRAVHLGGLREDDAMVTLRGLREDDAALRLGTAYAPAAEGESEGDEGWPVRARAVHLGESAAAPFGPMDGIRRGTMISNGRIGTAYYPSAEGESEGDYSYRVTQQAIHGLREEDAAILMNGLREEDALILLKGLREEDAGVVLRGLREEDAAILLKGLREDDAGINLKGLREEDAQVLMRGLREEDAAILLKGAMGTDDMDEALGRFKSGRKKSHAPYRVDPVHKAIRKGLRDISFMGAEDYHPRFPVELRIEGLGHVSMDGLFDFLKPLPSDEEYMGKIKIVIEGWNRVKPQLDQLPLQSKQAIEANMVTAQADRGRYEGMPGFLAEGASAKTLGRYERVVRLEAYLPTLQTLIDKAKALGPAVNNQTPTQTAQQTNTAAKNDVIQRSSATARPDILIDYVLPYGGVAVGAGLITFLGLKLAGSI